MLKFLPIKLQDSHSISVDLASFQYSIILHGLMAYEQYNFTVSILYTGLSEYAAHWMMGTTKEGSENLLSVTIFSMILDCCSYALRVLWWSWHVYDLLWHMYMKFHYMIPRIYNGLGVSNCYIDYENESVKSFWICLHFHKYKSVNYHKATLCNNPWLKLCCM